MKLLLNTNIYVVLKEYESALNQGFRFIPGRSNLHVSPTGLYELELFKQDIEIQEVTFESDPETVVVSDYDKNKVLISLQKYLVNGYTIADIQWFSEITLKSVRAYNELHPNTRKYSKEELTEMSYEDLKQVGKLRNCFNRSRDVMTNGILKYQEGEGV